MTKRFAHVQELVFLREQVRKFPEQTDRLIKESILYTLPRSYVRLYEWIRQGVFHPVTSAAVAKAWDIKQNHASSMLNELWQFGLLERTERIDESGKRFVYKAAE
jgi:predicted transcriptional regulator